MGRLFSGVKPTSDVPHLGNYLGAFRHWVELQSAHETYICVVDLHSITVPPWAPETLPRRTRQIAASLLALGIDPESSTLFVQSDVPEHTELSWILTCISRMGELGRMTQFKDKSRNQDAASASAGLFMYPVLMAADVLVYMADLVPIGDDQKQHLELMRDLAERFNREFGDTFPVPDPLIAKTAARVMSLDDPARKMDKSAEHPHGVIWLNDSPEQVKSKVARAVTDSGREVSYGPDRPAISNLLDIYSVLSGRPVEDIVGGLEGKGYADLKSELTEVIVSFLDPFNTRFQELAADPAELDRLLAKGAEKARPVAAKTLELVRERTGLRRS